LQTKTRSEVICGMVMPGEGLCESATGVIDSVDIIEGLENNNIVGNKLR